MAYRTPRRRHRDTERERAHKFHIYQRMKMNESNATSFWLGESLRNWIINTSGWCFSFLATIDKCISSQYSLQWICREKKKTTTTNAIRFDELERWTNWNDLLTRLLRGYFPIFFQISFVFFVHFVVDIRGVPNGDVRCVNKKEQNPFSAWAIWRTGLSSAIALQSSAYLSN